MITTLFLVFAIQLSFSGVINHDSIIGGGGDGISGGGGGSVIGGGGEKRQRSIPSLNHRYEKELENRSTHESLVQPTVHADRGGGSIGGDGTKSGTGWGCGGGGKILREMLTLS